MNPEDNKNTADLTMPKNFLSNIFSSALFYLTILLFIIGFNFSDRMAGNWYQQFMPNIGSRNITDVFFIDSLTGWAVTNATNIGNDTTFVLKTTNSGDTWVIHHTKIQTGGGFSGYFRIYFLNQNTGYACDVKGVYKTTDGGTNWVSLNAPLNAYLDMSVLSTDTIWIVSSNSLTGGVFRTTNGGANWEQQFSGGTQNPNKIYMYNAMLGFMSNNSGSPNIYRTTNGGQNWNINLPGENFYDMHFVNSLTGWKSSTSSNLIDSSMKKTTNGGQSWVKERLPYGPDITQFGISRFTCLNKDTIWAVGNNIFYPNSQVRGILMRTTDGGNNWMFQIPDTSINVYNYYYISFINKNIGWAYSVNKGIHTTAGGDPLWITGLQQISNEIPRDFKLYQNYPNPFNPKTNIKYQITKNNSNVQIIIYDIQGRKVTELVNQKQNTGTYGVDFSGTGYSSGVYFYKLIVNSGKEVFTDTKKMILIK